MAAIKILFNGQEVVEVYFEYITRDRDVELSHDKVEAYESEHGCHLQFHTDLIRKSATQIIRLIRSKTPIWRGVKTLVFSVDSDIFKYEGDDKNGKKIVTVIIPFAQVNSIQTYSRKGRVTKRPKQTFNATMIQELK
jgi:polyphosphate kinase